jgi:hypothetical protein
MTEEDGTCTPCPVNTFSSKTGATSCTDCPAGMVSGVGAKRCHKDKGTTVPLPTNQ